MMNLHYCTMKRSNQLYLFLSLIFVSYYLSCLADGITTSSNNIMCLDHEREALLQFKEAIQVDFCGMLSSWVDDDDNKNCCQWHGIRCSNRTGNVIKLNLRGILTYDFKDRCLQGKVSSSLVDLKYLSYLDLSLNNFQNQPFPAFVGSLVNLKYLNLSYVGFSGEIPYQLGNLSWLTSLDLSINFNLYVKSLSWLSHLTFLTNIDLSFIDLSKAIDWLQIMNNFPFLRVLHLNYCQLSSSVPRPLSYNDSSHTLSVVSFKYNQLNDSSVFQWLFNLSGTKTHLTYLDLSGNNFKGTLPAFIGNMQSLSHLALSYNKLQGTIPASFGNMQFLSFLNLRSNQLESPIPVTISNIKHLTHLDLSINNFKFLSKSLGNLCNLQELELYQNNLTQDLPNIFQTLNGCTKKSLLTLWLDDNQIWGPIPDTIDTFSSLRELYLRDNRLNGTITQRLGNMFMLETLYLSSNSLKGTLLNNHFSNLTRLKNLDLSNNSALLLNLDADWIPPFQLDRIFLGSCILGPMFPKWLLRQTNYSWLDISGSGISDSIPKSFWMSLPPNLEFLNLSHNKIYGTLPDLQLLPIDPYDEWDIEMDLSFNNIEGKIPAFLSNVTSIFLNNNKFTDPIPFLCPKHKTKFINLDLSNNFLFGGLPDCWMNFDQLLFLKLENNNFSGIIPASFSYLNKLESLHLSGNNFSNEIPRSLMNCTSLVFLNLGSNSLGGHIPLDIGNSLSHLRILSLRSNNFVGGIPLSLCQLSLLQYLDLSDNRLTGTIPKCINNLRAMQNGTKLIPEFDYDIIHNTSRSSYWYSSNEYTDVEKLMWKKTEQSLTKSALKLARVIDLSNNKLEGEIPDEISFLAGLVTLNLSRNHLQGNITAIGHLTSLEALDLSNNHLSGEIPTSLADMNSLSTLDLSNNQFSGKIPKGPQLQTFDTSSYAGNPGLCGMPLPQCPWDQIPDSNPVNEDESESNDHFFLGLYISIVLGFIIGFWGVCGTLVLKRSWRHAFFRFFDDVKDKLYVMVFVHIAKVRRRL